MSRPVRVVVKRQPQTRNQPSDFDDNDNESYDNLHDTTRSNRNADPYDSELIRTKDISRQKPSSTAASSSLISPQRLLIVAGIILLVAAVIVVPTVLAVIFTRNPTVINNTTSSTVATPYITLYWSFDNTTSDLTGTYNGTLTNGATFSNNTYFGYGFNLVLNNTLNESILISSPFLNLSYTSFTVEAWIYGLSLTGDNTIFSQCACSSCQDQCLYLIIRNYKMYMGFLLDDVVATTSLSLSTWYHVAFVYDYSTQTQLLYLQGVLDGSKTSSGPYKGRNGSTFIGSSSYLSASSFNGFIDNLIITTRAKSATEVLADASIVVYYSFDGASLAQDMGPNQMNGTISNCGVVDGRVGNGLALSGSSAYLQIYGFYQLGRSNKPFSFVMWIYPYSVAGGVFIYKSVFQYTTATWCQVMMGLTYVGQIAMYTNGGTYQITGPFISSMRWTHIVYTYSTTSGQTMYVNGVQYASTGAISFSSSNNIDWLTIGYNFGSCTPSPIYGVNYQGVIDEFYVYRRELTASEVYALANP